MKRSKLRAQVKNLELGSFDFRLLRGLEVILDRRADFAVNSPVEPYQIRRAVFSRSRGFSIDPAERERILEEVGLELKLNASDVEKFFWNDLEEEQILKSFDPFSPEALLASYNLSLTQTLLFRATSMEFEARGNWKRIFRSVKRLGLMYSISQDNGKYVVSLEGPVALMKLTERYGTNIAKLIPEILSGGDWILRAQVAMRWQEERKLFTFVLGSSENVLLPSGPQIAHQDREYDSSLESSFARRFSSIGSRWILLREPDLIPVGSSVMIPDFAFVLGDKRVYLEIVGFWTKEYLERKLTKLGMVRNVDMIVAVDSNLGISKRIPGNVIPFEGEVPLKPILEYLEKGENDYVRTEMEQALKMPLKIEGDCVNLVDLARTLGVSKEALHKRLEGSPVEGYTLVGDCLLSGEKIKHLERVVSENRSISALIPMLEAEGIADPYPLLKFLGYRVVWKGLESDSGEYYRPMEDPKEKPSEY